jgi:aminopeptidase N
MGLYPTYLAGPDLIARTDTFLDGAPDLPAGARRLVLEARDGVSRALRCQGRDA